ncbi:MAG: hypothetical protein SVM80_08420 [Halobacteriota archaeon]|nr:hypothetical protein [Halobacteriota archaeon]
MPESKSLMEKIWWVIPPILANLFVALIITVLEINERIKHNYTVSISSFPGIYVRELLSPFLYTLFSFPEGLIIVSTMIVFIGLGYYLSRKRSITVRIVVTTVMGIVRFWMGLRVLMWLSALIYGGFT